MLTENICGS